MKIDRKAHIRSAKEDIKNSLAEIEQQAYCRGMEQGVMQLETILAIVPEKWTKAQILGEVRKRIDELKYKIKKEGG